MKKALTIAAVLVMLAASAMAGGKSVKVCDAVLINASSVNSGLTTCTIVDVTGYHWFALEAICDEPSGSDAPTYDVNFIAAGSGTATLAAPVLAGLHSNGTVTMAAVGSAILNDITAETWQPIKQVPISLPAILTKATLQFLNNEDEDDVTCSAWLHMAD